MKVYNEFDRDLDVPDVVVTGGCNPLAQWVAFIVFAAVLWFACLMTVLVYVAWALLAK